MMIAKRVIVYKKPGCCLCDTAQFVVRRILDSQPGLQKVNMEIVDISSNPELDEKFGDLLPVVQVGEEVVSELRIDSARIRAALINNLVEQNP
jgi:hypothetical protein